MRMSQNNKLLNEKNNLSKMQNNGWEKETTLFENNCEKLYKDRRKHYAVIHECNQGIGGKNE